MTNLDQTDRAILSVLQRDAGISMEDLGTAVNLSRNAVWRRVKLLEDAGVIRARVALLDPVSVDLPLTVFVQVRTSTHSADWLRKFATATSAIPEILGVHRMTGDLDYLIRIQARDVADYDRIYQSLIARVPLSDVSASFVMENIKDTHALPLR
ncbi:transcriptional regulator [Actibacterium mucosum KCTC 23349]|uniref:Transcriptional regulator n=1 Tax=Actibacterium mucosum KCTC 23349 TaxID=1454373 RepID=A0A037ZGZ1_9RHOB|nr:Lrp/AsnC family transcriptional regulator [Actibacterium mucosum]KAJ55383.1 transcriptional regulator [Actibacterium mucosum KCTC 23349]